MTSGRTPWIVGVSGASGTAYAAALLRGLLAAGESVDLIVSRSARLTLLDETGIAWREDVDSLTAWLGSTLDAPHRTPQPALAPTPQPALAPTPQPTLAPTPQPTLAPTGLPTRVADPDVRFWAVADFAAGPSSGSYRTRGMVVVPASAAAVAGIALGLSKDLLQRAADVTLKERRRLVVVPRETPLTGVTLRHLVALDEAGAVILPASPGFYARPKNMQQLVDFVAGKILDVIEVEHDLFTRWAGRLGD